MHVTDQKAQPTDTHITGYITGCTTGIINGHKGTNRLSAISPNASLLSVTDSMLEAGPHKLAANRFSHRLGIFISHDYVLRALAIVEAG